MTRRARLRVLGTVALAVAAAVAVTVILLVRDSTEACACAIPPDDDAALTTAQDFVAALAAGDDDAVSALLDDGLAPPDPDRVAALSELAGPDTTWLVTGLHRPEGGYGRSPGERVAIGVAPDGSWDAVMVRTETDYAAGRVGPQPAIGADIPPVVRGGTAPIFGDLDGSSAGDDTLTLIAPGHEPEPVEPLRQADAWAYTGPDLTPGRYLVLKTVTLTSDDAVGWRVDGGWFEVAG